MKSMCRRGEGALPGVLAWLAALLMLAPGAAAAQDPRCWPSRHVPVPLRAESAYAVAREALLNAGWQPIQSVHWRDVEATLDSDAKLRWHAGQTEVEWCMMSSGHCSFLFKDIYDNYLRVLTAGEGEHARIARFTFVCAP